MKGCPKCKVNSKTLFEECKVTKQVIEGKVECDFGYENCEIYKAACARKRNAAVEKK